MSITIHKYGGTSLGSLALVEAVADRVVAARATGKSLVVVVSAMSGETDRLFAMAQGLGKKPSLRELDVLLSTGEQVSIALLCIALQQRGVKARSFTGGQACIHTDSAHTKARITNIVTNDLHAALQSGKVAVVAGFQGVDEDCAITTLGRGGSDTTAVALAAALQAEECLIYTDVAGVYTADPRIVPEARCLDRLTYEEMLEMASLGAKVLQPRSVELARNFAVRLRVLSSFSTGTGTLINTEEQRMEQALISGIAHNADEAKLTVLGVPDKPGVAAKIIGPISNANIDVDMIVQNVGERNTTDFTFTVHRRDYQQARDILQEVALKLAAKEVTGDDGIVKISVIGVGMRSHTGIASRVFQALAEEGINIRMISTSEIKISVVVEEKYMELAVRTLHSTFDLGGIDKPVR